MADTGIISLSPLSPDSSPVTPFSLLSMGTASSGILDPGARANTRMAVSITERSFSGNIDPDVDKLMGENRQTTCLLGVPGDSGPIFTLELLGGDNMRDPDNDTEKSSADTTVYGLPPGSVTPWMEDATQRKYLALRHAYPNFTQRDIVVQMVADGYREDLSTTIGRQDTITRELRKIILAGYPLDEIRKALDNYQIRTERAAAIVTEQERLGAIQSQLAEELRELDMFVTPLSSHMLASLVPK